MSIIEDIQRKALESIETARDAAEGARNIIESGELHRHYSNVRVAHDQILSAIALLAREARLLQTTLSGSD